jgi:hypothetical protein
MGNRVELTWFRDIRRYISHCQKQGQCLAILSYKNLVINENLIYILAIKAFWTAIYRN